MHGVLLCRESFYKWSPFIKGVLLCMESFYAWSPFIGHTINTLHYKNATLKNATKAIFATSLNSESSFILGVLLYRESFYIESFFIRCLYK